MNLPEYIKKAIETESVIDNVTTNVPHLLNVLGTIISVGNLLDVIKKDTFYGLPTTEEKQRARTEKLIKNAGDLQHLGPQTALGALPHTLHQKDATETLSSINPRVAHAIIGLATEAVELLEALRKAIVDNVPIDRVNVLEELGDLNWYHAIAVDALNGDWEQIQVTNIAKLRKRNKGAQFNANATHERDVEGERKLLEDGLSNTQE